ncbi:uncharacterized protein LOC132265891 [Phlebotomus argentipes]|uniref:uncharacterized protein LOC132265891 n=1 Tax=Phlebotomus argentipes TaxID=94469 RepID=UPI0028938355|nr:uncharacterized protein LOC132265891 [Phlebotomus argentipes]
MTWVDLVWSGSGSTLRHHSGAESFPGVQSQCDSGSDCLSWSKMGSANGLSAANGKRHRSNGYHGSSARIVGSFTEEPFLKPRITERSLASVLFLITVLILIVKLTFMLKSSVQSALQWRQLVRSMWTDPVSGRQFVAFAWAEGFRGQFLVCPLLCGLAVFLFAWFIVYFDSRIPGVDPPMPRLWQRSSWPLAYKTSVIAGLLAFSVTLISPHL